MRGKRSLLRRLEQTPVVRELVIEAPLTLVNTRRIGGKPVLPVLAEGESIRAKDEIQPTDLLGAVKVTGAERPVAVWSIAAVEDDPEFWFQARLAIEL